MTKAIIFDMDGVIIDSEPLWKKAIIQIMNNYGYNFDIEMCNRTKGMRVDEVTLFWKEELNAPFDSKIVAEEIVEEVIRLISLDGKEMDGLEDLLKRAKSENIRIALASSSSLTIIETVLTRLNISSYFEVVQSAEKEQYGKPHPAVFITAANNLGVSPNNCIVIEDSLNGVIAGKAAKMKVVAIPEPDEQQIEKFVIADQIITSLRELTF
ncbi:MAG: hexitol phosphatase HxpB [Flavobacteriales bacterium]|jgi:HAD superfamily hydrolase (TIGR01509 family)|nr:hexitol phosphatase HxpB [Flavobacteriales bacterium]MDG1176477.1 hexitol phosphatase HxpB [Flavobacteriales bacterium]